MQTLPGKTIILCGGSGNRYASTGGTGDKFVGRLNDHHPKEKPVTTLTTALDLAVHAFKSKHIGLAGHDSALRLSRDHVGDKVHLECRPDNVTFAKPGPARGLFSFKDWMDESNILILLGDNLYMNPEKYMSEQFDLAIGEDALVTYIETSNPHLSMRLAHISTKPNIAFCQPPHTFTGGKYYAGIVLVKGTVLKEAMEYVMEYDERPEFLITTILTRIAKENNMVLRPLPKPEHWYDVATLDDLGNAKKIYDKAVASYRIGK